MDYIFNTLDSLSHTDKFIKREHVNEIKEKGKEIKEKIESGICPKCGGRLVVRSVKNGPAAGKRFLGCSNYPKCKPLRTRKDLWDLKNIMLQILKNSGELI